MPVPDPEPLNDRQLQAAAALLAAVSPQAAELGDVFAAAGHELALVGGPVRDVFLGRQPGDLDLTTDAPPPRVLQTARPVIDSSIAARLKRGGGLRYVTTREKRNQAARQAPQLYGL